MLRLSALSLFIMLIFTSLSAAQDQCGVLDTINYPIDVNTFQMVQDFAVSNSRHQGRFHTGEDWFGGRSSSLGQPVRAAARGLVVYSSPSAWGVDGGVIIIRHTLESGDFLYTQYGHLEQTDAVRFPPRLGCVEAGEVIGVIGDARPAPHLHFEVRVYSPNNPNPGDNPGPGYTRTDPELLGWRSPMQMITNMQARLSRGYEWHTTLTNFIKNPPLILNDGSLIVIDGDRLRRITADGRVLWRVGLSAPAVSVHGFEARTYVTFSDGRVVQVDVENGNFLEAWQIENFMPDSAPLDLDGARLYHTSDNTLVAISSDGRTVLWQTPDVPPFTQGMVSRDLIGLVIEEALWTFSREGVLLDQAELADGVSLSPHPDGGLIAYTQGGLWQINMVGEWSVLLADAPAGGQSAGAVRLSDGRLYLTDSTSLYAYDAAGQLAWQAQLPQALDGQARLIHDGDHRLMMTSNHGNLIVARDSGGFCGFTRLYGTDQAAMWYDLGADGTLRFAVGDQIIGLDWERFTNSC